MLENMWVDVDIDVPKDDEFVLISFSNFPVPDISK